MKQFSVPALMNRFIFRFLGYRVEKIDRGFEHKRARLISVIQPDLVIDGGANVGQWASEIKRIHPHLKIWSFEPLENSRKLLEIRAKKSATEWKVFPFAIGREESKRQIYVASNSQMSSSILIPTYHSLLRPDILFQNTEEVSVITLDSMKDQLIHFQSIFLKLDVQGSEMNAIQGGLEVLKKVSIIELESSFTPLYEGETAHHELISSIKSLGFTPWFVSTPSFDNSGRQFALDTILVRNDLVSGLKF